MSSALSRHKEGRLKEGRREKRGRLGELLNGDKGVGLLTTAVVCSLLLFNAGGREGHRNPRTQHAHRGALVRGGVESFCEG